MIVRPSTSRDGDAALAAVLERLVYELLDAHADTVRLAEPLREEPEWAIQLDYLRDLQRVARGQLAKASAQAPPARRAAPARTLSVRPRIRFQPTTPRTR